MADDGPPLLRPIPRRPFQVNFPNPAPEDDVDTDDETFYRNPNANLTASPFLSAGFPSFKAATPISRPDSLADLTSSTLYGIYSDDESQDDYGGGNGDDEDDEDEDDAPWELRAHTPVRRSTLDQATYELMKERSHLARKPSVAKSIDTTIPDDPPPSAEENHRASPFSMTLRAAVLFALGVGYGVVLSRFQDSDHWLSSLPDGIAMQPGYSVLYLAFWGLAGVALGALLPWFDRVWAETIGEEEEEEEVKSEKEASPEEGSFQTDWALVMRAIGAFVGIVFAIRKLAWASTLQVSITLALVNPLLWWLIDRSTSGLILSALVGFTGSAVLLGVNPEMMPAPSGLLRNAMLANSSSTTATEYFDGELPLTVMGGIANQGILETGVWMLSVLFCSCVCFGNIGRRLAWDKTAGVKGRWGGMQ